MNKAEISNLLNDFRGRKKPLELWANYVLNNVINTLPSLVTGFSKESFFKTPPTLRLKDETSFINKTLKKNYSNPIVEITDQVGIRFVLLTTDDVAKVCELVTSNSGWTSSKDRDYETEIDKNPFVFGYKSMHFVVRPKETIVLSNTKIDLSVCCEIQIRTLLQHAYAELSHFVTYKPKMKENNVKKYNRSLARSMALIETVDETFNTVMNEFVNDFGNESDWLKKILSSSSSLNTKPFNKTFNEEIIDKFRDAIVHYKLEEFDNFLNEKKFIFERINHLNSA
jgi:putative GTP pyrophosphokinase